MKICMIGCGSHSTYVHGPSYKKYASLNSDAELAACCDINPEAAAAYAKEFGFARTYTDYMEMLNTEKPDAVGIVMPVSLTEKVTLDVLNAGYSCAIEKPPAETAEGVLRLAEAHKKSGKHLCVHFNRRFMPLIRTLKDMLKKNGEPIQAIHFEMHRYRRGNEEFSSTAIHGIDLVKYVAGADYEKLSIERYPVENDDQKGYNIYLHGHSVNGAAIQMAFIPVTAADRECISVHTNHFSYFLELPSTRHEKLGTMRVFDRNKLVELTTDYAGMDGDEVFARSGFYNEVESFLDGVKKGVEEHSGSIESSVQSVAVANAVRDALSVYKLENK